jgi:hypothetical protein
MKQEIIEKQTIHELSILDGMSIADFEEVFNRIKNSGAEFIKLNTYNKVSTISGYKMEGETIEEFELRKREYDERIELEKQELQEEIENLQSRLEYLSSE